MMPIDVRRGTMGTWYPHPTQSWLLLQEASIAKNRLPDPRDLQ